MFEPDEVLGTGRGPSFVASLKATRGGSGSHAEDPALDRQAEVRTQLRMLATALPPIFSPAPVAIATRLTCTSHSEYLCGLTSLALATTSSTQHLPLQPQALATESALMQPLYRSEALYCVRLYLLCQVPAAVSIMLRNGY